MMRRWRDDLTMVAGVSDLLNPEKDAQESLARGRRAGFYDVVSNERQLRSEADALCADHSQPEPAHPEQSGESEPPSDLK